MAKTWGARLKQWATIGGITGAMIVAVGEIGLRIVGYESPPFWREDARCGWSLRPELNTRYREEGGSLVTTSSIGLRDTEHDIAKPKGTYRVAVLGDSYAEAIQVDQDKTFWSEVARSLESCPARRDRKIEMINFGVSSFGTANELLRLENEALAYSPDFVLTTFCPNDLMDNHPQLDHMSVKWRPYFTLENGALVAHPGQPLDAEHKAWQGILTRSRLAQLVDQIRRRRAVGGGGNASTPNLEAGMPKELLQTNPGGPWQESWLVTEALLGKMRSESEAHGARFLLAAITTGMMVNPDDAARARFAESIGEKDLFGLERHLAQASQRQHFEFLPLGAPMLEEAKKTNTCFHGFPNTAPCSGHWNEAGHKLAGQLIAARMCAMMSQVE